MNYGDDLEEPAFDAEDCNECDCPAGEFDDSDWRNGTWYCPECGAAQ